MCYSTDRSNERMHITDAARLEFCHAYILQPEQVAEVIEMPYNTSMSSDYMETFGSECAMYNASLVPHRLPGPSRRA